MVVLSNIFYNTLTLPLKKEGDLAPPPVKGEVGRGLLA
jgi:hypothetical protein